jgi:hypothetical protein
MCNDGDVCGSIRIENSRRLGEDGMVVVREARRNERHGGAGGQIAESRWEGVASTAAAVRAERWLSIGLWMKRWSVWEKVAAARTDGSGARKESWRSR